MISWTLYLGSYLLGCFPTGKLVARAYGVNISQHGSGNIGATNLARVLGKKAGIVTLIGDAAKGILVVVLARFFTTDSALVSICGLLAVCGHCVSLPPFLKGGKGVATSLGVLSQLVPLAALGGVIVFGILFAATRVVSLSSIAAACAVSAMALLYPEAGSVWWPICGISLIVVARHWENIQRLRTGTEKQFVVARGQ